MLTLTRKVGQKIRIGDEIEIVVREIRGRQVRLGISAPESMPVYREELYLQIAQEGGARAGEERSEEAADPDRDHEPPKDEG
ncbi:MAG: carbon storage regulator CsrA [Myxococcales bacterium]|nr:carbon storage regulator CsrA [Myxococcales bacterium]MCB9702567.1 carbon storage regulator CsrA [Myxococcales bacterium]